MANPVDAFLAKASHEVAKRELGYDQEMIENDPNKADEVTAVSNRFLDDIDDSVKTMTAKLAERYGLKGVSDKLVMTILQAIAQEAYLGNISLNSIENNDYIQSVGNEAAKEQKRVEVVQSIMSKCADVAFGYTVASAVAYSTIETMVPEKTAFIAAKEAVRAMNMTSIIDVRMVLDDYNKSKERFLETRGISKNLLDLRGKYDKQLDENDPSYNKDMADEYAKLVGLSRLANGLNMSAAYIQENIMNKIFKDGDYNPKEGVIYDQVYNALKLQYAAFCIDGKRLDPEDAMNKVLSAISLQFPVSEKNSAQLNDRINKIMVSVKNTLVEAMEKDKKLPPELRTNFDKAYLDVVAGFCREAKGDMTIARGKTLSFVDRMTKSSAEKREEETIKSDINMCFEGAEATKMMMTYTSLMNAKDFTDKIKTKNLARLIMVCNEELTGGIREKIASLADNPDGKPENVAAAKDMLLRYDILKAAHIGTAQVDNKDSMIALMLNRSLTMLGEGVKWDELREALKGSIIDSGFMTPDESIEVFDNFNNAKNKEEFQESIGKFFESLDIGDIEEGDGTRLAELCMGTVTQDSINQERIRYTEMCARVQNKDLLGRTQNFIRLLNDPNWKYQSHNNMEMLLVELRTQEPELHEYMLKKLEEVDKEIKLERTYDRVEKVAERRGLYVRNEDGTRSIDASVQEELFDKYYKITKGEFSYLIEHEREEMEKLRAEQERVAKVEEAPVLPMADGETPTKDDEAPVLPMGEEETTTQENPSNDNQKDDDERTM